MKRTVFVVWFIILLCWSVYRAYFRLSESIDELIVKPLIFVLPVLIVVMFFEKKPVQSLGIGGSKQNGMVDIVIGVVLGVVFALEGLFANYLKYGTYSFSPLPAVIVGGGIVPFLLLNLATSTWEEILGRGYLFQRLDAIYKNKLVASLTSSFLFIMLHMPILFSQLHLSGISLVVYPISIFILSMTNCYLYAIRGSLILPILVHAFWNMTVALYL